MMWTEVKVLITRSLSHKREIVCVGIGQVLSVGGSFIGLRLLTSLLPPSIYGELSLVLTAATFIQQIIIGPCTNALTRFYSIAHEQNNIQLYIVASRRLLAKATLIGIAMMIIACVWLYSAHGMNAAKLVVCAGFFAFLAGCNAVLDGIQNAARQRAVFALHQGVAQWLRVLFVFAAVSLLGLSTLAALIGYCAALLVMLTSQSYFLNQVMPLRSLAKPGGISRSLDRDMQRFAWPIAIWGVFGWAQFSADRWAIESYAGTEAVGLYAVVCLLGVAPVSCVSTFLLQLISPILFQMFGTGKDQDRVRQSRRINAILFYGCLLATAVITVAALCMHKLIFMIFVAPAYYSVSYLLPWATAGGGLFAAAQVGSVALLSNIDSHSLMWPKIWTALLAACLYVLGGKFYGLTGVVIASMLASATYCVWIAILLRQGRKTSTRQSETGLLKCA